MRIEVDQSGKIEESRNTVIAFSNDEQFTVMMPKQLKNRLLKNTKPKRQAIYRIFARGVYCCIKDYINKDRQIIIDEEYRKHWSDIKNYLLNDLRKNNPHFNKKLITFRQISDKSKAHRLAYQTYSNKLKPNRILAEKDFEGLL